MLQPPSRAPLALQARELMRRFAGAVIQKVLRQQPRSGGAIFSLIFQRGSKFLHQQFVMNSDEPHPLSQNNELSYS